MIERSGASTEIKSKLFDYFYTIEGSDWNWWNTFEDITGDFKKIFLSYIKAIYKILAKRPPSYIIR
jgi:alpha-amylase/alpha-mannosidase (GH57 family)